MHYRLVVIGFVISAVSLALPALADNSLFGPSGLLRVPSAQVVSSPGVVGSVYIVNNVATTVAATVKVLPTVEISPAWVDSRGGDDEFIISAKWRILDENEGQPAVALGVFDATDQINFTLYGVVQKGFTMGKTGVNVMAGLGGSDSLVDGFFCGAQFLLGSGASALVEYDGNDVNAGIRWPIADRMMLTAGLVNDELGAGLQYNFR